MITAPGTEASSACRRRAGRAGLGHYGVVTIKHPTASTFVFSRPARDWQLCLVLHPVFGRLMIPGGHVEPNETPPEAALREVAEETGLAVSLVRRPGLAAPGGVAASGRLVSAPWWIMQQPLDRDNQLAEPHFHVDHLYVAIATVAESLTHPAHPVSWHHLDELGELNMFTDTRMFASVLFEQIDALAADLAVTDNR
jgi:8-oxo-dGTP pyrophosphatase MutT (NUDIX family)